MKNFCCQCGVVITACLALALAGCQPDGVAPAPQAANNPGTNGPPAVDLDAALAEAGKVQRPLILLIAETDHGKADKDAIALLADPAIASNGDRITFLLLDVRLSRNRATATRFHLTDTPMLVCLSPRGVIVSRDEGPITKNLVLRQIAETVRLAPGLDARLAVLEAAVAKNGSDVAARLNLADFLLVHQNAREAIPHLESVAHVESIAAVLRVNAWVALARAHLWIAEPEKGRHEATELIATLGMELPEARAGGQLVLGLQDAKGKRFALARREFEEAIAAAPRSGYAKQAAEEAAKLPPEGK